MGQPAFMCTFVWRKGVILPVHYKRQLQAVSPNRTSAMARLYGDRAAALLLAIRLMQSMWKAMHRITAVHRWA